MRHFRPEEQAGESQGLSKVSFNETLTKSLGNTLKLLPFAEFTVNYGYAIENVWVTMLMIVHKTPAWLDSFVWIIPVVVAAFLRPYIARYIHQINLKVYRQVNITSFFLVIGALGCFVVGLSCDIQKQPKTNFISQVFYRLVVCTIGWILMDVGFEFCLYFAEKIKESHEELLQEKQGKQTEEKNEQFTQQNFAFYGLLVGYIVSALICWIIHGSSIKAFYKCAKYAYFSAGILSGITGLRMFIEGRLNLPQRSDEPSTQTAEKKSIFALERKLDFYLPGLTELLNSNSYTFCLLMVHFVIVFLNDIVLIYTTMWFSDLKGAKFSKQGEAYIYGLEVGSLTLLLYTVIDNLKIKHAAISNHYFLLLSFVLVGLLAMAAFYRYSFITFALYVLSVAVLNHFYRKIILNHQSESNALFERCIEITERIEKIVVLSIFPGIVLLILNRDDIPDALPVTAGLCVLASLAFLISKLGKKGETETAQGTKAEKLEKIE